MTNPLSGNSMAGGLSIVCGAPHSGRLMHSSVAVGFRPAAAAAPEYKESNASEQRSNASDDPRDADGRQDRGQNEGCDAQKNEQHADNDMNHLLPVLIPRGFDQESEIHSTIYYASCATGVP